ncbi:MAG: hypothetical protein ACI4IX_03795 [Acutalibacteraceae bacterium]
MLKKENPFTKNRNALLRKFSEMNLPFSLRAELTKPMDGQSENIKEKIAEALLQIVSESSSEKEMLEKAAKIKVEDFYES